VKNTQISKRSILSILLAKKVFLFYTHFCKQCFCPFFGQGVDMVNAGTVRNLLIQYSVPVTDDLLEQLIELRDRQEVIRAIQAMLQQGDQWNSDRLSSGTTADDGFYYRF
jgi:hypothetical protein